MSDDIIPAWDFDSKIPPIHPIYKTGKRKAKFEIGTHAFAPLIVAGQSPPPEEYFFDTLHPEVPAPVFANDKLSDCVVAARAHQTLRFELLEQGKIIAITDQDVTTEYFSESGGQDNGLVILDSLKEWRDKGWLINDEQYTIRNFATINWRVRNEIKLAIIADVGVFVGVQLPVDAANQIQQGQPWDITTGNGSAEGSWGGHAILITGYDSEYLTCITWGVRQRLSWAWFERYCDEAYAVFDAADNFNPNIVTPPPPAPPPPPKPVHHHPWHKSKPNKPVHPNPKPDSFYEAQDICLGIKYGWSHGLVAAYFAGLKPRNGEMVTTADGLEMWTVGRTAYVIRYNSHNVGVTGIEFELDYM